MRFLLAYRFLKSKDNTGFINIISKISVIGIVLGITVLITVMSVMNGFERQLQNKILGFTSHVTLHGDNLNSEAALAKFDKMVNEGEIIAYSYYHEEECLLISENQTASAIFRAVNPKLESKVNIIAENIIFGNYDEITNEKVIIIGSVLANKLMVTIGDKIDFVSKDDIKSGKQLGNSYIVGAIYDVGLYEYNEAYAFIDLKTLKSYPDINITKTRLKIQNPLDSFVFAKDFNKVSKGIYARDWTSSHKSLFTAINNEKRVMFVILVLIIAVASFNIVSSLLMLIKNKEKEISILKSLGASKNYITTIFMIQGIALGAIGIILGIIFGILLANNVNEVINFFESIFNVSLMPPEIYHLSEIPSLILPSDIRFVAIFSSLIIFLSSLYPARRAASIKPAKILRGIN